MAGVPGWPRAGVDVIEFIIVGVLVSVAALYLLRRVLAVIRPRRDDTAGCGGGCGCGPESPVKHR